jgi:hypothetical protein
MPELVWVCQCVAGQLAPVLVESSAMIGKIYYETGELRYDGELKHGRSGYMPSGRGVSYYQNGQKHFDGLFNDWFIDVGQEYYPNGNLKFEGNFNKRPMTSIGPRYYASGILYRENGVKWFIGTFNVLKRGPIESPLIKFPECFYDGIEYSETGELTFHVPSDFLNYVY